MSVIVTTQAELDAALAAKESTICIESPAGAWLTIRNTESSHVEARGSSHVEAWGSSHVEARGSSHVVAWGSSHVAASPYVAVHLHSAKVTLTGGVVIDLTALDLTNPATWCDFHGVEVIDGQAVLFKALDGNLDAGQAYKVTRYEPGTTVTAPDWKPTATCGYGLHLGPTTHHATAYRADAKRWVRVLAPLDGLVPLLDSDPKCKVQTCTVVAEVDRYGKDL